jgi:hypothetical protein
LRRRLRSYCPGLPFITTERTECTEQNIAIFSVPSVISVVDFNATQCLLVRADSPRDRRGYTVSP